MKGKKVNFVTFLEREARRVAEEQLTRRYLRKFLLSRFGPEGEALVCVLPDEMSAARLEALFDNVLEAPSLDAGRSLFSAREVP